MAGCVVSSLYFSALLGCAPRDGARPIRPRRVPYAWATFDRDGDHRQRRLGPRRPGARAGADDRRSGADRLHLQAGRRARRDAAGRAGPARSRPRRLGLSRLARCAIPPFRTGRSRCGCCSRIAPRSGTASIMPSRSGPSCATALADPAAFDAEHPPGAYFRYSNLNFPVIASVMERATGERFDRLMARLVLRAARPRRLLQLDDLQRRRDRPRGRALRAGRQRAPRRSRRPAARPARCSRRTAACDLAAYRLGSNGALFSPQGGLRISVRDLAVDRPAAAQPRPARRRPLPQRGEHRRAC